MPNWCSNCITITKIDESDKAKSDFYNFVKTMDVSNTNVLDVSNTNVLDIEPKWIFSFRQIVPIDCPPPPQNPDDELYCLDGLKRLNLSMQNWGVCADVKDSIVEVTDDYIVILCDTVYPPFEWAGRCSKIFPNLCIKIYFKENQMQRCETHTYTNNSYNYKIHEFDQSDT